MFLRANKINAQFQCFSLPKWQPYRSSRHNTQTHRLIPQPPTMTIAGIDKRRSCRERQRKSNSDKSGAARYNQHPEGKVPQ